MTTLRLLVLLARSLVILTIGITGAAVVSAILSQSWQSMAVSISFANPMK
jgi:hypothetical protein